LFWGPFADRHGNKRIMVIGLGALTVLTKWAATVTPASRSPGSQLRW